MAFDARFWNERKIRIPSRIRTRVSPQILVGRDIHYTSGPPDWTRWFTGYHARLVFAGRRGFESRSGHEFASKATGKLFTSFFHYSLRCHIQIELLTNRFHDVDICLSFPLQCSRNFRYLTVIRSCMFEAHNRTWTTGWEIEARGRGASFTRASLERKW